jgi:hypothetical protein
MVKAVGSGLWLAGSMAAAILLFSTVQAGADGCVGAVAEQSFGATMSGCAGTVAFEQRETLCAPGYHVCSAQEWVDRRNGQEPSYHYWTNDNLHYNGSSSSCWVSLAGGNDCGSTPMRVCAPSGSSIPIGGYQGVFESSSRFYTIQNYEGTVLTVVLSVQKSSLAAKVYLGTFTDNVFNGTRIGSSETLHLTFSSPPAAATGAPASSGI